jgi:hypothetical protein
MDYLHIVGPVGIIIVVLVLMAELIKAGKVIYEFIASKVLKIQTKSAKKKEQEAQMTELILQNNLDLQDFMKNQSAFNNEMKKEIVSIREDVATQMNAITTDISKMKESFNEMADTVTDMQIEGMRETILEFASALSSPNGNMYTKEQFTYVRKIYRQYTDIINAKNKTNDEVDLSMIIINDKYEYNVLHHTFVEDLVKNPNIKHDIDEEVEKSKNTTKRVSRKKTSNNDKKDEED